MVELTEQNISEIELLIEARGVEMKELSYDLVDHVCCMVEAKMEDGKSYTTALEESIASFGKKGIRQIQEETTFLLTKNILAMRKTMHITGITAAILLLLGSIFKIQHWPGAGAIYVLGTAFLCFLFMPLFLTVRIKEKPGKLTTISNIIGVLGGITLSFGILFKIMHWPFANLLMNIGGFSLLLIFLPIYLYNGYKTKQLKTKTIVPVIISVAVFSLMFSLVSLRNSKTVDDVIVNLHYTIQKDTEQSISTNDKILSALPDSNKNRELIELDKLAKKINEFSHTLNFMIVKNQHQDISNEKIEQILTSDFRLITDDLVDLKVLRDENRLDSYIATVNQYKDLYNDVTGINSNIDMNSHNMEHYKKARYSFFLVGLIIRDISYMNLQVQKTHTGLLQFYKGKVS